MVLVNTFCVDSFEKLLTSKAKTIMVLVFMVLLLLNIVLEVLSVGITVIQLCKKSKKVEQGVQDYSATKSDGTDELGRVMDIPSGKSRKKEIIDTKKGFLEAREEIKLKPRKQRRGSAGSKRMKRNPLSKNMIKKKKHKKKKSKFGKK